MYCPTVRIKADVTDENAEGFVVVNESDFDSNTMTLFVEGAAKSAAKPKDKVESTEVAEAAPWTPK